MTPFAVTQRAARLAPELDRIYTDANDLGCALTCTTEDVLRALHRAGLTLDADLAQPSTVSLALKRLGAEP